MLAVALAVDLLKEDLTVKLVCNLIYTAQTLVNFIVIEIDPTALITCIIPTCHRRR